MTSTEIPRARGMPGAARTALALVILAQSTFLALPAAIYLWSYPDLPNALSLALSLGFFCAIFTLVRPVWLQLLIGLPILLLNMVEIVHILAFGGLISLGAVEAVFYVDPMEAREFATEHGGLFLFGALVVALSCVLAWFKKRLDDLRLGQRLMIGSAALLVPFVLLTAELIAFGSQRDIYLPTRVLEHYTAYLGVNPLTHTISGFATTLAAQDELQRLKAERDGFTFNARREAGRPAEGLYIVVIGESSRRRNWSLFGYKRPTNPLLGATPGLIAFSDALSPATTTGRSLPVSFSFATAEDPDIFYRSKSFVSAFREVGFKTFWISNQGTQRTAVGNQIALAMGEADEARSTNFGFWNSVLDEALLPELDQVLADPAPRKLIVLHTLGSHTNYAQRFPTDWALDPSALPVREVHGYKELSDAETQIIESYDKTISYTDWFLHQIIERHRSLKSDGAVVYFSDHGQRLYDDGDRQKGHGFSDYKREDAEIPLLLWLPDLSAQRYPDRYAAIKRNAAEPVSTGSLATSVLDLAGIEVDAMDRSASFFGPAYKPVPRKVQTTDGQIVSQ